jgi:hypothetical protein
VRTLVRLLLVAFAVRVAYGAWPDQTTIGLIIGTPLYVVLYLISIHRRPYLPCRRCQGTNKRRDRHGLWTRPYAHCRRCGGTGDRLRLGARLLTYRRHLED